MEGYKVLIVVLLSTGAIQGIVYGVLLVLEKQNQLSNRLLASILFLFSYRLVVQCMRLFGLGHYDTFYYFMLDLSWINGALLYFYVKTQISPSFSFHKKDIFHFIPLGLQVSFSIFVRLQNLYWDGTRESLSWLGYWGYVIWMNHATVYIVASLLIIIYAYKALKLLDQSNNQLLAPSPLQRWLKTIIFSFLIYFLVVLLILLTDLVLQYTLYPNKWYFYFNRFYYYPFFGGLSILTYWLGLEGFKRRKANNSPLKKKNELSTDKKLQLEKIAEQVAILMQQEKIFTDPSLSLQSVAKQLDIKPYLLSKSLNIVLGVKFIDYINQLRVQEVQSLLNDPKNEHYSLLGLAMTAGFNSKSSFNRAVKKHLGISPSDLKQQT